MTSINDFATTYMCQSLPFGGVKESGFDRFAGIEGLRGMCIPKAICEDRCACQEFPDNIVPAWCKRRLQISCSCYLRLQGCRSTCLLMLLLLILSMSLIACLAR